MTEPAGAAHPLDTPQEPSLRDRLTAFVARERALRAAVGQGGQSVGYSPSVTPSVLKELERMLAASLPLDTGEATSKCNCQLCKQGISI